MNTALGPSDPLLWNGMTELWAQRGVYAASEAFRNVGIGDAAEARRWALWLNWCTLMTRLARRIGTASDEEAGRFVSIESVAEWLGEARQ